VHEMGIAVEIYRAARDAVRDHGSGRLETVTVSIGELSAVEPELLRFAWEAVVAGGPDAGATLSIRWCPADQHCPACGEAKDRSDGSWLRLCPDCGNPLSINGGTELDVEQVIFVPEETT